MITVTPIQEKEEQARLCALCHIPFCPDLLAYFAKNAAGEFAGICQFKIDTEGGHIHHLAAPPDTEDIDPLFVMGRAALNFMDLCGAKTAFFEGVDVDEALLSRIGFVKNEDGTHSVNLEGFFTHPCQHHPQ